MTNQNIIEQCEKMSDEGLVRALTVDKGEYTEAFRNVANDELKKRGNELGAVVNVVQVRIGEGERETVSIDDAIGKLNEDFSLWNTIRYTNYLSERITIQRASLCWSGSYEFEDGADFFIARSRSRIENILKKFLNLDNWQQEIGDNYDPSRWVKLTGVSAFGYLNTLCENLSEKEVASCIKVEAPGARSCQNQSCNVEEGPLKVFIDKADMDTAEKVLEELKKMIDTLYNEAEAFEEGGDSDEELEIYNQLFDLVPEDETVAFNRGVLLFDKGRYDEAAESFIVSAFNRNDVEIREDSEDYLDQILEELPENLSILHSLASLSMENGDSERIEEYYKRIIAINPSDALAHLNLGHLYYADSTGDEMCKDYFKKFIELAPESYEAQEVMNILEELK